MVRIETFDETGLPAPSVEIRAVKERTVILARTDSLGKLALQLPRGTYYFSATVGLTYPSRTGTVILGGRDLTQLTFHLLSLDNSGAAPIRLFFDHLRTPLVGNHALIRYESKKITPTAAIYSGRGLELAVGRMNMRGGIIHCAQGVLDCRITGQTFVSIDGKTYSASRAEIKPGPDGDLTIRIEALNADFERNTLVFTYKELVGFADK
jgi:hypothetical protein